MKSNHTLGEWMVAVRPWSFPASLMPVAVTLAYLYWLGREPDMANGVWALVNIVVFHAAGNVWSDYFDYKKGVDAKDTFGVRTLTDGVFRSSEIKALAVGLLVVAVVGGLLLAARTGWPLIGVGVAGVLCVLFYPFLKYNALGDACIFLSYALLPTLGTAYVATGIFDRAVMWIAVPVGLITVAILHANNTRDIQTDRRAHIRTFAMMVGGRASMYIYQAEVLLSFVWVGLCACTGVFPMWTLLVLPALFPALMNVRMMARLPRQGVEAIVGLDEQTAKLQLIFSLLLVVSFLVTVWAR